MKILKYIKETWAIWIVFFFCVVNVYGLFTVTTLAFPHWYFYMLVLANSIGAVLSFILFIALVID